MKRVAVHTLGCKLNVAETATIARQFTQRGFEVVGIDETAQVVVINTCSVTERADRECRQVVRRALRHSPGAYVVVMGCYAQLQPYTLSRIQGVNLILGAKEKFELFRHAGNWEQSEEAEIRVGPIQQAGEFGHASTAGFADRTRAFLKIQDGCDFNCSFCTIPLARGESRSVAVSEVVSQARTIASEGYREIVLTGVNVGDYGKKIGTSLPALLKELVRIDELQRLRISSIEPNLLDDELLDFWLASPKICKHFHIPLQAGSNEVLKGMRRRYRREWYADRIVRIRSAAPDAGIGSDVIVGFPGETEALFSETYQFLVDQPLSYLHVFTYSERPRTVAASLPQRVEAGVRAGRSERLRMLSMRKKRLFSESFLGKSVSVLFETGEDRGTSSGLTGEYLKVTAEGEQNLENQIRSVKISGISDEGCVGVIVPEVSSGSLQKDTPYVEAAA